MADPVPYVRDFGFTDYQSINPDLPLPGISVDVELDAVQTSVGEIIDALATVRRSDGNLQNGVVSWDGLSDDVKARITGDDARVTIGDINPAAFAQQSEAVGGVANDKIMTPLRTKQAVDEYRGFSSQAQAQAGTNETTVMNPLRTAEAIDEQRAFASQAEAQAAASNTVVLSPLRGADLVGSIRRAYTASSDLTWGEIAAGASATQTIAVANAALNDRVVLGLPHGIEAGLITEAWVSAANTVTIRITNITGDADTPLAGAEATFAVTALRF